MSVYLLLEFVEFSVIHLIILMMLVDVAGMVLEFVVDVCKVGRRWFDDEQYEVIDEVDMLCAVSRWLNLLFRVKLIGCDKLSDFALLLSKVLLKFLWLVEVVVLVFCLDLLVS